MQIFTIIEYTTSNPLLSIRNFVFKKGDKKLLEKARKIFAEMAIKNGANETIIENILSEGLYKNNDYTLLWSMNSVDKKDYSKEL